MDWEERFLNEDTPWERGDIHPAALQWFIDTAYTGEIVVPGCGRSHEPLLLAQCEFQVSGLDISKTAIAWQRQYFADHNATGMFIMDSLLSWTPANKVDAVYEQTCLCALQPELRQAYASQINRWLKPGGILYANFMQRPGQDSGPPFNCSIQQMRLLFSKDDWQWLDDVPIRTDRTGENHELGYRLKKR